MHRPASAAILVGALVATIVGARGAQAEARMRVVSTPPIRGGNRHYQGNRAPLLPSPLVKLPVGSVRPAGWLRSQLDLEAEGFSGRLTEISPWCKFHESAWVGPGGQGNNGWEELPYWLKGYVSLGYVTGNRRITAEAERWISGILATQQPDGYFGPAGNRAANDLWPNMLALYALRTQYEATHDRKTIDFMLRYFRWINRQPIEKILPASWQKLRGGDNLEIVYWLYNRTGEPWLLDLARVNHERTADWVGGIASAHGVNFAQCFREPAIYYQQTRDPRYLRAAERNYDEYRSAYGRVPGGLYGADENARPGFNGPRQAAETCAMVEMMYSSESLAAITGDPKWADRCEDVAFNSLPASMTPDLKGLHYLTAPNMVQLDRASKAPMIENGGDMLSFNPYDFRCCQHNAAMGWPYFTEHLWMATQGNGLAAVLYAPSQVTARVGASGSTVTIREDTAYPFDERVILTIHSSAPVRFPLLLRVPGWCAQPTVRLNDRALRASSAPRGWLLIDRTWKPDDRVALFLPMQVRFHEWTANRHTVSVERGPLTYSLKIGERWQRWGGTDRWPAFEVFPTSPWNYGLAVDPARDAGSVVVKKAAGPIAAQPFTPGTAPIALQVPARRIPEWKQEANGLVGEVQPGPIRSDQPVETVTLIPMGAARLRISAFPVVTDRPDGHAWGETAVEASASYANPSDPLSALSDGQDPGNSAGTGHARFTWWNHIGTVEWVQYTFLKPRPIGSCAVYWFDDEAVGGQCRVPAAWRVLTWDGSNWREVSCQSGYPVAKDAYNRATFAPITTTRIRIEVKLRPGFSGGILQWKTGA